MSVCLKEEECGKFTAPSKLVDGKFDIRNLQFFDFVAQLVEQLTLNQRVQGSSPCEVTTFLHRSVGRAS